MKRLITLVCSFALVAGIVALGASSATAQESGAEESTVEVDDDGTEFDPKVDKSKLPEGAWYCDMKGVHYARMDKGDGKCELCGMKLDQKEGDEESEDDDHGHDHGEHDH